MDRYSDGASPSQTAHSRREEENDDGPNRSPWETVPEDILVYEILLRVQPPEALAMRAVCKSWKTSITEAVLLPICIRWSLRCQTAMAIQCWVRSKRVMACYHCQQFCQDWPVTDLSTSCYYECYRALQCRRFTAGELRRGDPMQPSGAGCLYFDRSPSETKRPCHRSYCAWREVRKWHRWLEAGYARTSLMDPRYCEFRTNCMATLLYVCNPLTGTWERLPAIPGSTWTTDLKCIARDDRNDGYTILVAMIPHCRYDLHRTFECAMVYRSATAVWKRLPRSPPGIVSAVDTHGVCFKGTMYWLLRPDDYTELVGDLLGFCVDEERWVTQQIAGSGALRIKPLRLVGCSNVRLMMVGIDEVGEAIVILELSEEQRNDTGCRFEWLEVSRSEHEFYREFFVHRPSHEERITLHSFCRSREDERVMKEIICFENLTSKTALTYDVETRLWCRSPTLHTFDAFC